MTPRKDRRFDWDEARKRRAAGETYRSIADSLGVTKGAIQRVVKLPVSRVRALAALAKNPLRRDQDWCPRCHRPKNKTSELCRSCRQEMRLAPLRLRKIAAKKRAILNDVPIGGIVLVGDRWGVVMRQNVVDFWEGGREVVPWDTKVEVAETFTVHVGGKAQEPQEIEVR